MNQIRFKYIFIFCLALFLVVCSVSEVSAFCGFFVAKADATLSNSSSRVVIAREGNRSLFMMANDYQGDVKEFTRIVPIPVLPTREQVRIGNPEILDRLDAYTAPRLVQYVDDTDRLFWQELKPYLWTGLCISLFAFFVFVIIWIIRNQKNIILILCGLLLLSGIVMAIALPSLLNQASKAGGSGGFGQNSAGSVIVEDRFTLGEYDIVLLNAQQSDGLIDWLTTNDYQVPESARSMFQDYIDNDMKFFVVRVNLEAFKKEGYGLLRPIILDYESPNFMLPIRLGTLNATGEQDLIVHILSPNKFAEVVNYRTTFIPTDSTSNLRQPSGDELPAFVRDEFSDFYDSMFQKVYENEGKNVAFLEYAGSLFIDERGLGKCDPCTLPPTELIELRELLKSEQLEKFTFVTRLHVRYSEETFPEDLIFQEISQDDLLENVKNAGKFFWNRAGVVFQGRYVIRRPENDDFSLAKWRYRSRWENRQLQNLVDLTGWQPEEMAGKMKVHRQNVDLALKYYRRGQKLANSNQWEEALIEYDDAIDLDRSNPGIWLDRGLALWELDRRPEAIEAVDRSAALDGSNWEAISMGNIFRQELNRN